MKTVYVFKVFQTEHGLAVFDKAEAHIENVDQFYYGVMEVLETISATGDYETIKAEYEKIPGDIALLFVFEKPTSNDCRVYFLPAVDFVNAGIRVDEDGNITEKETLQ